MQVQAMKRLLGARLWRFCSKLERNSGDYEALLTGDSWPPFHVYRGQRHPRLLLYCTKNALLERWVLDDVFPATWIGIAKYGLPTPDSLEEVRLHASGYRLPVMFVGDLDPLDLTIFSIIRQSMPAHYLGIDDSWVALSDAHRRGRRPLASVCFKMTDLEREHWLIARQLLPDAERLVGPRCFALLESFVKLELEGAASLGTYPKNFSTLLVRHLARRAARLTAR